MGIDSDIIYCNIITLYFLRIYKQHDQEMHIEFRVEKMFVRDFDEFPSFVERVNYLVTAEKDKVTIKLNMECAFVFEKDYSHSYKPLDDLTEQEVCDWYEQKVSDKDRDAFHKMLESRFAQVSVYHPNELLELEVLPWNKPKTQN